MTTYTLRSASPAKTRADVVVVGVVSTTKGVELAAGAEDVAEAHAALREGDAERAMASYRRLRDFWAGRAAHQRAN